jgi:hypothetical protein
MSDRPEIESHSMGPHGNIITRVCTCATQPKITSLCEVCFLGLALMIMQPFVDRYIPKHGNNDTRTKHLD